MSAQRKTVLELYDMENQQKRSMPYYQKLKTMVKRSTDQKRRLLNFDARHGRIVTIVRKNQNTMPPHLLRQPFHEVDVCRGKEVCEAKVTMVPFFDKRAVI